MLVTLFMHRIGQVSGAEMLREDSLLMTTAFLAATNRPHGSAVVEAICAREPKGRFDLIDALFNFEGPDAEKGVLSELDNPYSRLSKYSRKLAAVIVELHHGGKTEMPNVQLRADSAPGMKSKVLALLKEGIAALPPDSGWACSYSERGWFPFCGYFDDREYATKLAELEQLLYEPAPAPSE